MLPGRAVEVRRCANARARGTTLAHPLGLAANAIFRLLKPSAQAHLPRPVRGKRSWWYDRKLPAAVTRSSC